MDLDRERTELERLGFRVSAPFDDELVGIRQKWHRDCIVTRMTYVVFVRSVDVLTETDLDSDRERLIARAKELDPSLLPRGFQRGVAVLTLYRAGKVTPGARNRCRSKPKIRFAFFYIPAALDESSCDLDYLRETPFWGAVYFVKFRHLIRSVLAPEDPPVREPISVFGTALGVGMLILFVLQIAVLVHLFGN